MVGLQALALGQAGISNLPAAFAQLGNLERLDLWDNGMEAIPNVLSHMTHLRHLDMSGCCGELQLDKALTFLTSFSNLQHFVLQRRNGWDSISMFYLGQTVTALQEAVKHGLLDSMPQLSFGKFMSNA